MLFFKKILFIKTYHYFHNKCFLLMIPEGSCDIEGNDCWKFSFAILLNCSNISQYYCFYCINSKNKCKLCDHKRNIKKKNQINRQTFGW